VGDLEAHGVAAIAPAHLLLDRLQEVLGFVLVVVEVEVAGDAERPHAEGARAGEEVADVHADHLLEEDVGAAHGPAGGDGDLDQAAEHRRHLHDREACRRSLGAPAAVEGDGEVEGAVSEVRERVAGVDGERRERRVDLVGVVVAEELALLGVELRRDEEADADRLQSREQLLAQHAVLLGDHALGADGDARELLDGAEAVGGGLDHRPPWNRSRGESPRPASWCLRPATRTMKNSSRLEAEMASG
jgi:hypothetical protein